MTKVLIYGGKTGWIGGMLAELMKEKYGEHIQILKLTADDFV